MSFRLAGLLVVAASVAVSSCGGGGGGGGSGGSTGRSFSLSSTSVSFSATQGAAAPAAQKVTVSVTSGTVFVLTSQSGNSFGHTFAITGPTTGEVTITPGVTLNAGTFNGTITVHGCSDAFCQNDISGSPQTINVTYTITGLGVSSSTLDFASNINETPTPQNVTLSLTPGGSASWTSSVNYTSGTSGWLALTPSSGTLNPSQTIALSVNAPPGSAEVRTATVTFTSGTLTQNVTVFYNITAPSTNFVAPYVVPAGAGGDVIVRGHGFSALNAPSTTVQFGALAPQAASVVSDNEIHVSYPALTAGSYSITVSDGATTVTTRSGVKLLAVDPLPFPAAAATITRTNSPFAANDLVYDAERQSLYLMDQQANRLERYQFNGATWAVTTLAFLDGGTTNRRIALSPDGTLLLKTSGSGSVLTRIDTATFTVLAGSEDAAPVGSSALNRIAFANDGAAIGNSAGATTLYRYDMLTRQFVPLATDFNFVNRHIAGSADGDTLVMTSPAGSIGQGVVTYDASNGTTTQRTAQTSTNCCNNDLVSISRDGSRILLITTLNGVDRAVLYDASFAVLGRLPTGLNGFVVTPDGSAAYAYYPGTTSVRKFDLNTPDGSGGFAEIGSAVVSLPAGSATAMAISPDGGALFLANDHQVIALAAP